MPTQLPVRPDLEYLKKQAKALMEDRRRGQREKRWKLADAQRAVAQEYGFQSWRKLKEHVEEKEAPEAVQRAKAALREDDAVALRRVFKRYAFLKKNVNAPLGDFDAPLLIHARSTETLDVLLKAGADINARSTWWAGGFGLLDTAPPAVAMQAIERGATVTVHAAARLGMVEKLRELVEADPSLVNARGGDGQTPLHFASTVEIAEYLLDRGADIDALDVDHVSTPAQYMLRSRPEVARFLVIRGAKTDILMAAALGDLDLVKKELAANPDSIRVRVSPEYFPLISPHNGGSIYQWELGWHVSACQVARSFGHPEVFDYLMERCPDEEKLLNACWLHDEALARTLLAKNPNLASLLPPAGKRHLAHAARNNDSRAAELMLEAGFPLDSTSQHMGTAFHWAAWHGSAALVRKMIGRGVDLENRRNEFGATPLGWAMHGSLNGWYKERGDYPNTVEALLDAGAKVPENTGASAAVFTVLKERGIKSDSL